MISKEKAVIVQLAIKFGGGIKPKLVIDRSLHEEVYKLFTEGHNSSLVFKD